MQSDHEREQGLVAGRKPVLELLRTDPGRVQVVHLARGLKGPGPGQIIDACKASRVRFRQASRAELDRLYGQDRSPHQGVVAVVSQASFVSTADLLARADRAPLPLIVALDQVQDPGNVGALARTLYALGGIGLILPRHGSARLGPVAVKASAGALNSLPVALAVNLGRALDECFDAGFDLYLGALRETAEDVFTAELSSPAVLVLGNEEKGVRAKVAERCPRALYVPMARDFDSLNVAQAGAIMVARFAAAARQRM